ncbi:MAG: NTP transferase domain-containing protein [Phycisphaerales bacterium]|nr:NTP transferase domain-containing protein [Phycisphaerales bacterium]
MNERVRPVVLVGGRSRRFGRDKLREPFGGGLLVDRPIAALRGVFGACVALVGDCDAAVAARGDSHHADRFPGRGPIGGVLTALDEFGCAVFVLSGDLPCVTEAGVRSVLGAALADPGAAAVVAATPRVEPCFGVYRPASAGALRRAMEQGRLELWRVIEGEGWATVPLAASEAVNVNSVEEAERAGMGRREAT